MLLTSIERGGAIAWSPLTNKPNYLAIGGTGGILDQNFNTSAHLEIFELNFHGDKEQLKSVGKVSAADRFSKLIWGVTGVQNGIFPMGLIVGGLSNGGLHIWNPAKIVGESKEDAFVTKIEKNASAIQGLEFNPFVHNLLASGNAESEIFIYDISNTSSPTVYTPGNSQRTQSSGITSIAWNRKVQHILASSSLSGVTVIWDLKAKKPVLEFSDPNKKLPSRAIAWNPEEPTQIITASADDNLPVIQVWDLRNTYTPTKVLEGHQKGIWALSWCPMDTDLLLSSGKDNRTICWNMKTGEALCDIEQSSSSSSWNNDIQWSPRIPAVLSATSLEGKVKIFSAQDIQSSTGPTNIGSLPGVTAPRKPSTSSSHAPKWLKRPVRATFGFGGKLISFNKSKPTVKVSLFETNPQEAERAEKLYQALENDNLKTFCEQKLNSVESEEEKSIWNLLKILASSEALRPALLKYLGFDSQEIASKLEEFTSSLETNSPQHESKKEEEEETKSDSKEEETIDSLFAKAQEEESVFESVVKEAKKKPQISLPPKDTSPIHYEFNEDADGMVSRALIVGNLESAVQFCIAKGKMADALVLAAYGGSDLWNYAQDAFFRSQSTSHFTKIVAVVVKEELKELIERADLSQWKVTLAILCTYAKTDEFALLCSLLGNKLSEKGDDLGALLCFICAGHVDRFVQMWEKTHKSSSISHLLDLIEQLTLLRKALKHKESLSDQVSSKYADYAQFLASQGKLETAIRSLSFLKETKHEDVSSNAFIILDRLYHAQRLDLTPPPFPFKREEVQLPGYKPAPKPQPNQQQPQPYVPSKPIQQQPVPTPQMKATTPVRSTQGPSVIPPPSLSFGNNMIPPPSPSVIPPPSFVQSTGAIPKPTPSPVTPPPSLGAIAPPPSLGYQPTPPQFPPSSISSSYGNVPPPSIQTSYANVPPPTSFGNVPPPTSYANVPPPTSFGNAPPPTSAQTVKPPPPTQPIGPPPTNVTAPSGKTSAPPKQEPSTSSHDTQKILNNFDEIVNGYSQSPNDKVLKYIPDVKKRLSLLFEKISNNQLSGEAIQQFDELSQAILNKNVSGAQSILQAITKNHWEEVGSATMVGVKRLVEFLTL